MRVKALKSPVELAEAVDTGQQSERSIDGQHG
jgi:hypothetical protein